MCVCVCVCVCVMIALIHTFHDQALNNSASSTFYHSLAHLTNGYHLHLDQFASVVDFMMAICFREQSMEKLQVCVYWQSYLKINSADLCHLFAWMVTYVSVCMCVYMSVYIYCIYMYVSVNVCVYMCVYM